MDTNQVYAIVNGVVSQALGSKALTAVDASGLVSLGNAVISSQSNTEAFFEHACTAYRPDYYQLPEVY